MMNSVNRGYEGVPQEQIERLLKFRSEHPGKHINVAGVAWEYISCGRGTETLLLLTGGLRVAEASFGFIQMFEDAYRVIAPTYPPLTTMDELVDGIAAILDAEEVLGVLVLGQSYGGGLAQALIRRYPSRVKKVVLSGTAPLIALRWKKVINSLFLALMSLLPENMALNIFRRSISSVITVRESERTFWEAYLKELFERHLTKPDILSHFHTSRDAQTKYAYRSGEESSWSGDVLVIWGENDHLRTERGRRGMLEIYPQAQIHVILGGGHTVALSNPAEYAAAVRGFFDEM